MKDLVSLLDVRERKILKTAAVFAGLVSASVLIFAVRAQVRAGRQAGRLTAAEGRAAEAERSRETARAEFERWARAGADIRELASGWFYDPAKGIPGLRYDLRRIFQSAGIVVPEISYNEVDLVKDRLRRISAEFRLTSSYLVFRRFLETVENHRRALHVDKIEFEDIGTQPGLIQVRVTLAGYYLHEK